MRIRNKMLLAMLFPATLLIVQVLAVNHFIRELQAAVRFIGAAHGAIEANFAAAEVVAKLRQEVKKLPSEAVGRSLSLPGETSRRDDLMNELAGLIERFVAAGAMQEVNPQAIVDIRKAFDDARRQLNSIAADGKTPDINTLLDRAISIDRSLIALNTSLAATTVELRRELQVAVDRERAIHNRPLIAGTVIGVLAVGFLLAFTWAYADRHITRRLVLLSRATSAIAGGKLRQPIPTIRGGDEIAEMTQALSTFRDTALEIEEQSLRERQVVLDTIEYGVLLLDAELRVAMFNRAFLDLWSLDRSKMRTGMAFEDLLMDYPDRELHGVKKGSWAAYVGRRMAEISAGDQPPREWRRPDGRVLQYEIVALPDGGRMLTYFDLTELKRVEDELRTAKEQAELASRAKSDFLASMSHELRTPLNAIIGITEMLKEDAEAEADKHLEEPLGRVLRAGRLLLLLINEVLDLAKIEAGKLELQVEDLELDPFLADIVQTAEPLAQKNANRLVFEADGPLGRIVADPMRLRQVILNLLSNACKFTERGEVRLIAKRDGERIAFAVRDTGIGIEPDQLPHLFEEFHQAGAAKHRKYGGTGLGLAISRRLVELMEGRIGAESEFGKGSTFSVSLPVSAPIRAEAA